MNLTDTLRNEISEESILSLSQKLNLSPDEAKSGIYCVIPLVLAGILMKLCNSTSVSHLSSIFTGNPHSVDAPPESELINKSALLSRGSTLVSDLFDRNNDKVCEELAKKCNLSKDQAKELLTMGTPLVMSHVDKLIVNRSWSIADFADRLFEERGSIERSLPLGLISSFSLSHLKSPQLRQPPVHPVPPMDRAAPESTVMAETTPSSGSALKWVILIIVLALLAWWFLARNNTVNETIPPSSDTITWIM